MIRTRFISRAAAGLMAAVLVLACPGQEAFAQAIRIVRPAPPAAQVFLPPSSVSLPGSFQPSSFQFSAPALSAALPSAPSIETPPQPSGPNPAAPVPAAVAAQAPPTPKAPAPSAKELKRRTAERRERASEQKLIDRVLKVSMALEKTETGGTVSEEELKLTADKVWGEAQARPASAAEVEAAPSAAGAVLPKAARLEPQKMNGPPAVERSAPAKPRASVIRSYARGLKVALGRALNRALAPAGSLARRLPDSLVMLTTAATTIGLDHAARLLLPAVFGFSPAVGLWVVAGLGSVLIPALVLTRFSLARKADPALTPLTRYADALLGVLAGAAVVTALGVLGLDLTPAFTAAPAKGAGLISLAPLLGLFSFMAALPVLYGAGHTAWGLKTKTETAPELPVQIPYSLMLLPMLIEPMMRFLSLTGNASSALAFPLLFAAIAAYRLSIRFMKRMTAEAASDSPAAFSVRELLARWRLDRIPGEATTPDNEIRRARGQAALWGGALLLGSLGLLALYHLSIPAALAKAGASLAGSLMSMTPMILFSGYVAAFFMRVRRVKSGAYVEMVRGLAKRAGLPMPRVYAGESTGDPNAFAAGGVQHLSVVAVKGFITRLMTLREMRGVLAHELSHVKYRHMLVLFAAIALLQFFSGGAFTLLQMALGYWTPLVWMIGLMGLTRANERMADAGAAKLTGDPRGLATGLRKFALIGADEEEVPHQEGSVLYRLLSSHPAPLERVQTLGRMIEKPR